MSVDPLPKSRALAKRLGLSFPLLADADLSVTRRYKIQEVPRRIAKPCTFVLRRGGTVAYAYIGSRPPDRPAFPAVRKAVAKLKPPTR